MLWRWLKRILIGLLVLIGGYCSFVLLAYQDISPDELQQRSPVTGLRHIEVDGQPLYFAEQGEGATIVLLNSHFYSMKMWDAWVAQLAPHYRVIRYDMTSHGFTGPSLTNDYSMQADIALLDGLINHLNLDKVILVGSSLGGNIAINYTNTYPEKVTHLVLQNSGGFRKANSRGGRGEDLPGWANYMMYLLPKAAFDFFSDWMMINKNAVTEQVQQDFHNGFRREGNRYAEMQRIRQFKLGGTAQALANIDIPVLVQWGEQNPQLPVELANKFSENLTSSQRVETTIYPDTGHVLALERPLKSASDVHRFISGVLAL